MLESFLRPDHPGWPRSLAALDQRVARLRVRGTLPPLAGAVAIVGTRYADDDALAFTEELARALAAEGRTVISGGARGVDAAAHRGALDAGGSTVCVLASGFSPPYPPEHAGLFHEIAQRGALLSEQDDCPPHPGLFLARNRLIAALAEITVVIQAPFQSGALSTAAHARRLEKPVFAVPHAPWDPRGEGCLALLSAGARICTSARDVLSVPAPGGRETPVPALGPTEKALDVAQLDDQTRRVWGALGRRAQHVDTVATRAGLPIMQVHQALTQLLILGLAAERGPGRYARHPQRTR